MQGAVLPTPGAAARRRRHYGDPDRGSPQIGLVAGVSWIAASFMRLWHKPRGNRFPSAADRREACSQLGLASLPAAPSNGQSFGPVRPSLPGPAAGQKRR